MTRLHRLLLMILGEADQLAAGLMTRPRRLLLMILGCIVGVSSLGVALLLLAEFVVHIPMDYVVRAEFQELPASDQELEEWLLQQPGVYIGFVHREGSKVVLVWGHTQTHFWNPVTPNVQVEFERFGYRGLMDYREEKGYRDR